MRSFLKIADGIEVFPVVHALQQRPHLWNQDRCRTTFPGSPHAEVDDILLRFEDYDPAALELDIEQAFVTAQREWRPAWWELRSVTQGMIGALMLRVGAYELARVIITRLKPGGRILPHADIKGEYANLPDIGRYHVVLQGLPGSLFACGEDTVCMQTGEAWWFDAHQPHECMNNSADDRLHMLVDVRLMK